jgi:TolB-like protein/DNA-binding winged helix-turn-helix (wHTH) protein/tetratricopeptide (TPR) repeat protein
MPHPEVVRFGPFLVDRRTGQLSRHGVRIRLHGQPIQILGILLERPGELVTREELRARVWGAETFVDFEHGLNAAINKLRTALSDSADHPSYIETIPRHGYRFVGSIEPGDPAHDAAPASAVPLPSPPVRRRWAPIVTGLTILVAAITGVWLRSGNPAPPPARVMMAVLPFENLSGDPDQEYFSDGLTEEMITELGQFDPDRLGVIARTSVMGYKGTAKSAREISRELGVEYVLGGSVRRAGDRVRISAQLIRASDETQLWAHSYDERLDEVLPLQTEIARTILGEIHLRLPGADDQQPESRPVNWEAREAVLKGRYFLERRTAEAIRAARTHFERALSIESSYTPAYVGLAESHMLAVTYAGTPAKDSMPLARAAVQSALQIDDRYAPAHAELGVILAEYEWDWRGAEREYRRAVELNPNFAYAHKLYAEYLSYVGRFEEAIAEARLARRLDPLSIVSNSLVGLVLFRSRRYDEAVAELQRAIELDPNHPLAYLPRGLALSMLNRHDEAIVALEKSASVSGQNSEMMAQLALAYGRAGRVDRARAILRSLEVAAQTQHVSPFSFALAYAGLGEWGRAIDSLEAAYRERDWLLCVLKTEPVFDPVRGDPRFQALLRRLNLP